MLIDIFGQNHETKEMRDYCNYYGLPSFDEANHIYGFFNSSREQIFGHLISLKNVNPRGTVIVVHGYQSHSGDQKNVVKKYLAENKMVALLDFQGHGLSTGKEVYIKDFKEYVKTLEIFMFYGSMFFKGKIEFFGHSQGCAILSMYARNRKDLNLTYFAPLVRLKHPMLVEFISYMPIKNIFMKANVSSNKEYNRFANKDKLQSKIVSRQWLRATVKFCKEFMDYEGYDPSIKLFVVQGCKDVVVDYSFNIAVLGTKFRQVTVNLIDEANHQLQNESEEIRKAVFSF